jgi:hypothetical protein
MILFSGCTKDDPSRNYPTENYGTGGGPNTVNRPTRITQAITLNPTEIKLIGQWKWNFVR